MKLPRKLAKFEAALTKALDRPVPGAWPDEKFVEAEQPAAIGRVLTEALHLHLGPAKIRYLFKKELSKGGMVKAGIAKRASAQLHYLTGIDFVLTFHWALWVTLTPEQRLALVDHELCHCGRDLEANHGAGKWTMIPHDVEEFAGIVQRWGLWEQGLVLFGAAVKEQLELTLEPAGAR